MWLPSKLIWTTCPPGVLEMQDNESSKGTNLAYRTVQSNGMDSTSTIPSSCPTEASGRIVGARNEVREEDRKRRQREPVPCRYRSLRG